MIKYIIHYISIYSSNVLQREINYTYTIYTTILNNMKIYIHNFASIVHVLMCRINKNLNWNRAPIRYSINFCASNLHGRNKECLIWFCGRSTPRWIENNAKYIRHGPSTFPYTDLGSVVRRYTYFELCCYGDRIGSSGSLFLELTTI